jgi:hypothetical protein
MVRFFIFGLYYNSDYDKCKKMITKETEKEIKKLLT